MNLPKTIKGFTFRFLKIVLNCNGLKFQINEQAQKDYDRVDNLLKAYLIFIIIHEQNHFIKRYLNKGVYFNLYNTPKINEVNEGNNQLNKLLFGEPLNYNSINEEQANYILDLKNWQKNSVIQFRNDFMKIPKGGNKSSIVYLNSYYYSICDHSKLSI